MTYEIIGKLPLLRKRRLFRDFFKGNYVTTPVKDTSYSVKRKVEVDPRFIRVDGASVVGERKTASTKEEAVRIAGEMLASGRGFESVVIQDLEHPEEGADEFWLEKKDTRE